MRLYRISQDANGGYDTYSDAIVAAETPEDAKLIHPGGYPNWKDDSCGTWASPDQVTVEEVGTAVETIKAGEIVCASFHAG